VINAERRTKDDIKGGYIRQIPADYEGRHEQKI
jgi:hypothetical protein